jgi:hypothetical protein
MVLLLTVLAGRDQASLFLELRRVDFATRETLLKDFQRVGGSSRVALVLVRRVALPTALGAVPAVLAAAIAFSFALRLSFLHYLSPWILDLVRLDVALNLRNTAGIPRN